MEAFLGHERWQYFVDARAGTVVEKYNDTWYEKVPGAGEDLFGIRREFGVWKQDGTYYLVDTSLPMRTANPNLPKDLGEGNVAVLDARNEDLERLRACLAAGTGTAVPVPRLCG